MNYFVGIHVVEDGERRGVFVQALKDDQGASKTKRIEIGDEIVAMSASWGDSMWDVSFVLMTDIQTITSLSP